MTNNSGVAQIKAEYILEQTKRVLNLESVAVKDKANLLVEVVIEKHENDVETPNKKPRLSKRQLKHKGQNKNRGASYHREESKEICNTLIDVDESSALPKCEKPNCKFLHDVDEYLKNKPKDIGDVCYMFETYGHCPRGLSCRFGNAHITSNGRNKRTDTLKSWLQNQNNFSTETQWKLRKRTYDFSNAQKIVKHNDELYNSRKLMNEKNPDDTVKSKSFTPDADIISLLSREKKPVDFRGKLFLSPLTTVGNLPFRRICKEFGADVTCGEMAMCSSLLQGNPREWALVKRHPSEDIFGVQLCGNNPHILTKCAQLLEETCNVDFIDINMGCPIDLVYRQGGGCGMLLRPRMLEISVRSLAQILTIPLTLKTRTGVYTSENTAHTLVPKLKEWGVSTVTIHGRSREQRYTRHADWDYIRRCSGAVSGLPVVGNGDILSYDDYKRVMENYPGTDTEAEHAPVSTVMIGRGALIKPWLFTEIKEQRLWDIRSNERFDILRTYCNYGLEHWGSDNKGVENTRRFLLEWLSFLYRYIPVGLLEQPPQKINERPPYYRGRDDLETLMASPACADWIRISEMLLGPVPSEFDFIPKHKANSYQ